MTMPHLTRLHVLALVAIVLHLGCDSLVGTPSSTATVTPSIEQIQYCREIMYLNSDLEITALGHCHDYGFQDDAIHLKFRAMTDDVTKIFQPMFVAPEQLVPRKTLNPPRYGLADDWWDTADKALLGEDFTVPDPRTKADRELRIGVLKNADGTCTVYASWFEA